MRHANALYSAVESSKNRRTVLPLPLGLIITHIFGSGFFHDNRLAAEPIRDAILAANGALNEAMFGPPMPVRPVVHGQIVVGIDKTESDNRMPVEVPLRGEEFRRGIYGPVRRSIPLAMLHAFDAPVMEENCERRQSSTAATQSLLLMNSRVILDQAASFAWRLPQEAGNDRIGEVTRAWQLAFSRSPTVSEVADALEFLSWRADHLQGGCGDGRKVEEERKSQACHEPPARAERRH